MRTISGIFFWVVLASSALAEWATLENCQYVEGSHSDGDSIEVNHQGKNYVFRIYFVDTVETNPRSKERRAAQVKYFGMGKGDDSTALAFGREASRFTREALQKPFTVHTRWEMVTPGSTNPSMRAFVKTADGRDLGEALVAAGLAIIRSGPALSDHPDGRSAGDILRQLRELETQARVASLGGWAGKPAPKPAVVPADGILTANDSDTLRQLAGKPLKVRGTIANIGALEDNRITFLNFQGNERGDFVGIIRKDSLSRVTSLLPTKDIQSLEGHLVELSGKISLHRDTPQIEVTSPLQIKILD